MVSTTSFMQTDAAVVVPELYICILKCTIEYIQQTTKVHAYSIYAFAYSDAYI